MRIKKKSSKPSSKRPPLYFIGYRGTAPQPDELKSWYDLEYGLFERKKMPRSPGTRLMAPGRLIL